MQVVSLKPSTLAHALADQLDTKAIQLKGATFPDSEYTLEMPAGFDPAGDIIFLVHSTSAPVNENCMQLAFAADVLKKAGAVKVIGVVPYFGYARQHTGQAPAINLVIKLLETAGIDQFITVDLHEPAIVPLFSNPVTHISTVQSIAQHIKDHIPHYKQALLVAPDEGAYERVQSIAALLGCARMVFEKERYSASHTEIVGSRGVCAHETAIIIDDIIATGGTAITAAAQLREQQVQHVFGYFVHPVLCGSAREKITTSDFEQVFVSNTIPDALQDSKITTFCIAPQLAEKMQLLTTLGQIEQQIRTLSNGEDI